MRSTALFDIFGTLIDHDRAISPYDTLLQSAPRGEGQRGRNRRLRHAIMSRPMPTMQAAADFIAAYVREHDDADWHPPAEHVAAAERELEQKFASCRLYEGAGGLLTALRNEGWQIALISNLATPYYRPIDRLGLRELADVVIGSCDAGCCKPDPRIFHRALASLPAPPSRDALLMIGDHPVHDIEAAATAIGARGILVHAPGGCSLADVAHQLLTARP